MREHHEARMEKLGRLIEERRRKVEDHESGRRKLKSEEYDLAAKQLKNFNRKLKQLQDTNSDVRKNTEW